MAVGAIGLRGAERCEAKPARGCSSPRSRFLSNPVYTVLSSLERNNPEEVTARKQSYSRPFNISKNFYQLRYRSNSHFYTFTKLQINAEDNQKVI